MSQLFLGQDMLQRPFLWCLLEQVGRGREEGRFPIHRASPSTCAYLRGTSPRSCYISLNIDIVYICILYDRLSSMAKNTMGTKLPRKLEQKMQIVGEQIKLARLRRNLTIAQVAERATCSPLTVSRIEKGTPTVAIGIYLRVLYALQLEDDILWLAKEDELGRRLQDLSMVDRQRASKK